MTKKEKKYNTVTIIGGSYSGNKGAELMVSSVITKLGCACRGIRFNVLSYYPHEDKKMSRGNVHVFSATPITLITYVLPMSILEALLNLMGFESPAFLKKDSFRAIEECDLFIDVSGISFSDGREIYLPFNVLCILPPILLGKKVVKFSQAMGPFNGALNRLLSKLLLPRINRIFAREEETFSNLTDLGLGNVELAADSTFCVAPDRKTKGEMMKKFSFFKTKKAIVGISSSSVIEGYCSRGGLDYVGILVGLISYLNKEGYFVVLIPHSMRKDSKSKKNNDYLLCKEIAEKLGETDSCYLVDEELDGIQLRALIGGCDFYITSRFHGMISGLVMKVPTLVVGWGYKYLAVMRQFRLEGYVTGYESLSSELLEEKFEKLVREREKVRRKIEGKLGDVVKSSERNYEYALGILRSV
jgi:polysaccharide pyruvyl transferase WcaK-like protein